MLSVDLYADAILSALPPGHSFDGRQGTSLLDKPARCYHPGLTLGRDQVTSKHGQAAGFRTMRPSSHLWQYKGRHSQLHQG